VRAVAITATFPIALDASTLRNAAAWNAMVLSASISQ
jgi:hypothetical protein